MLDIWEDVAGVPLCSGAANFGSPGNAGICVAIVGAVTALGGEALERQAARNGEGL
jgi:hypothetical protein